MELSSQVEHIIQKLEKAVSDGTDYMTRLQEQMDVLLEAKDELDNYVSEAEAVIKALEGLDVGNFDDALDNAANLLD